MTLQLESVTQAVWAKYKSEKCTLLYPHLLFFSALFYVCLIYSLYTCTHRGNTHTPFPVHCISGEEDHAVSWRIGWLSASVKLEWLMDCLWQRPLGSKWTGVFQRERLSKGEQVSRQWAVTMGGREGETNWAGEEKRVFDRKQKKGRERSQKREKKIRRLRRAENTLKWGVQSVVISYRWWVLVT